jgi:hypothetical protein
MSIFLFIDIAKAQYEVCLPIFQILKCFLMVLEADNIRDMKFLHQQVDQVDAIAFRLPLVVQEGIGPNAFGVLKYQRSLLSIDYSAVRLGGNVGD